MRGDQQIRAVGIMAATLGYSVHTAVVGNGGIPFLGYDISAFGLLVISVILMALPETIDMLPFGPRRTNVKKENGKSD
jgi:hypothetical protein